MKNHSSVSLIAKSYRNGENRDIFSFFHSELPYSLNKSLISLRYMCKYTISLDGHYFDFHFCREK